MKHIKNINHIKTISLLIVLVLACIISFFILSKNYSKKTQVLIGQSEGGNKQEGNKNQAEKQFIDKIDTVSTSKETDSGKATGNTEASTTNNQTEASINNIGNEYALSPSMKDVYTGDTENFIIYSHKTGKNVELPFQWSVVGDCGKIIQSNNGTASFKAEKEGACTVVASYDGKNYTAKINIKKKTGKINIGINGKGKVIKSPEKDTYEYGDIVTLTGVPNDGWGFDVWVFESPFHSEGGNQIQIKFEKTLNLYANFSFIINIPDQHFETSIRNLINKPTGPIFDSDVHAITWLGLNNKGISNLEGLQYFLSLQDATFENNNITYIPDLSSLKLLSYINLSYNKIEDISGLANLKKLNTLYMNNNRIKDISPLRNLTSLRVLFLSNNQISDYSPVAGYYSSLQSKDFTIP